MNRAHIGRVLVAAAVAFAVAVLANPAAAQTGSVKGKVVDAQNQPVENAKVTIQSTESAARKHETKTNKKGEFFQIGLSPGNYKITAEKDKLSQSFDNIRVRLGDPTNVSFVLTPGGGGGPGGTMSKEEAAKKEAEIRKTFDEAIALNQAGKPAEAIAKFNEIIAVVPKCASCYGNIGAIHFNAKEYDKAEEAYKMATSIDPNFGPGYAGLVNVYNAQRKFAEAEAAAAQQEKAEAASAPAGTAGGGAGSADASYNRGVVQWNANKFAEAKDQFTAAIKANPNHAESHFMLGKVLINLGQLGEAAAEFETYLKMSPSGPNAKEAQTNYDALKSYIKK
ncbi:MAG TPA: tetratricopeptide repeat protein [Vicinamibacterales bacterium]|jgi:tetratricopeptide (TPR) repeat protein|nr:tetratricopeptide repeat protein [Vicinamibacterales bacterium]